jgi:hypothetical protein
MPRPTLTSVDCRCLGTWLDSKGHSASSFVSTSELSMLAAATSVLLWIQQLFALRAFSSKTSRDVSNASLLTMVVFPLLSGPIVRIPLGHSITTFICGKRYTAGLLLDVFTSFRSSTCSDMVFNAGDPIPVSGNFSEEPSPMYDPLLCSEVDAGPLFYCKQQLLS